jgi:hypothetical protein
MAARADTCGHSFKGEADGLVRAGVWESSPGTNRSIKGETWEYCSILAGVDAAAGAATCARLASHEQPTPFHRGRFSRRLTFCFADIAACRHFDPATLDASRLVDQDLDRA